MIRLATFFSDSCICYKQLLLALVLASFVYVSHNVTCHTLVASLSRSRAFVLFVLCVLDTNFSAFQALCLCFSRNTICFHGVEFLYCLDDTLYLFCLI